jgi:ankyrin repeat protein
LRLASFRGHLPVVELLIAGGAAVNMKGWTPLAYASFAGHLDIAKLLIKSGADVNLPSENGTTPLMAATRNGHIEIVRLLWPTRQIQSHAGYRRNGARPCHPLQQYGNLRSAAQGGRKIWTDGDHRGSLSLRLRRLLHLPVMAGKIPFAYVAAC